MSESSAKKHSFSHIGIAEAKTYKEDYIIECKRVIIHGCLHLLGYNDKLDQDKQKMTELEDIYLSHVIMADHK